jgi:hypothetical protein
MARWRYEFEMLLGVRSDVAEDVARRDERVRLYLPFGKGWWPYVVRRIGENPRYAMLLLRTLAGFTHNKKRSRLSRVRRYCPVRDGLPPRRQPGQAHGRALWDDFLVPGNRDYRNQTAFGWISTIDSAAALSRVSLSGSQPAARHRRGQDPAPLGARKWLARRWARRTVAAPR